VIQSAIARAVMKEPLSRELAGAAMEQILNGEATPAQIAAFAVALRMKGETPEEITGMAGAMRQRVPPIRSRRSPLIDTCGTGGDNANTFNISTTVAIVTAACGVAVAKHGNRAISSRAGSADVLEALKLPVVLDERAAADCFAATGFTFLYAPHYHPAMKNIAPVRAALGVRTVFNILGPLTNPAAPPFHVIGAYDRPTARLIADALAGMDVERAFVIHGAAGWDEPTPIGPFDLYDVRAGGVRHERRDAADYGLAPCAAAELAGGDAVHNAGLLRRVLVDRESGARRDALLLGAALALEVSGIERAPRAAVARLARTIDSGAAADWLGKLGKFIA